MTRTSLLPTGFADLEGFVSGWALRSEQERYVRLLAVPLERLREFQAAMLPRADAAVAFLSRYKLDEFPPQAQTLYDLLLTFVETGHPIDLHWRQTDIEGGGPPENLRFHGPSAAISCR